MGASGTLTKTVHPLLVSQKINALLESMDTIHKRTQKDNQI